MRVFAIVGLLVMSVLPCVGKGRVYDRPLFSVNDAPTEPQFDLTLVPPLELAKLPSVELPDEVSLPVNDPAAPVELEETGPLESMHAPTPQGAISFGVVRGAMLDRCRFRMRKVMLIGHGASTDGRPDTCRLLTFVGRTKFREMARPRKQRLRMRFEEVAIQELPEPYRPFVPGAFYPKRRIKTFIGAVR